MLQPAVLAFLPLRVLYSQMLCIAFTLISQSLKSHFLHLKKKKKLDHQSLLLYNIGSPVILIGCQIPKK